VVTTHFFKESPVSAISIRVTVPRNVKSSLLELLEGNALLGLAEPGSTD
jgi:hypothetical protein